MAVTEESRYALHQSLDTALGTSEAVTMMELLPPVGWADVATKVDLEHQTTVSNMRFDAVDRRFEEIDRRFEEIDRRFEEIGRRFDGANRRTDGLEQRLARLEQRLLYGFIATILTTIVVGVVTKLA